MPTLFKTRFLLFLERGIAQDEDTLQAHDKKYHPRGFDQKHDHCSYRDKLKFGDRSDLLVSHRKQPKMGIPIPHNDSAFPKDIDKFTLQPNGTAIVEVDSQQFVFTPAGGASGAVKGRLPGKDGQMHTFFIKHPLGGSSAESVANEYLANTALRIAGLNAPDSGNYDANGVPLLVTKEIDNVIGNVGDVLDSDATPWEAKKKIRKQMRRAYPVHAWLYNTDLNRYGVLVDSDYNVHFVDNGSAFMFRGGGDLKDDSWQPQDPHRKPWRGGNFIDRENAAPDAVDSKGNPSGIEALYNNQRKRWRKYCGDFSPNQMLRKAAHIDFDRLLGFVKSYSGLSGAKKNGLPLNPGEMPSFEKWTKSLEKAAYDEWSLRHAANPTAAEDSVDLAKHDAKYHPNGFNPETDRCSVREEEYARMAKEDVIPGASGNFSPKTAREKLLAITPKKPGEIDFQGDPVFRVKGVANLKGEALLDKVFEKAEENLGGLERLVLDAARKVGGELKSRPLNQEGKRMKSRHRAKEKADRYFFFSADEGGDYSQLNDLIGATLVMEGDDYEGAIEAVSASLPEGCVIETVKPYMNSNLTGYRDCKLGIRFPNGGVGEVIIIEPEMNDAKFERGGHTVYEVGRVFSNYAYDDDGNVKNPEAAKSFEKLLCLSNMVYADAEAAPTAEDFRKAKNECRKLVADAFQNPADYGLPKEYFFGEKGERRKKTWGHVLENWADISPAAEGSPSKGKWSS